MKNKLLPLFLTIILFIGFIPASTPKNVIAQIEPPDREVAVDAKVLEQLQSKGVSTYWLDFESDLDFSAALTMDWEGRGRFVYTLLKEKAEKDQFDAVNYLSKNGIAFDSYWINNSLLVKNSNLQSFLNLKAFTGLKSIRSQSNLVLYEPESIQLIDQSEITAIESNITHIQAPDVWALGYDGSGIVVANIDTGVRFTHEALNQQYRGNGGDGSYNHAYNWFDPYGDFSLPTDGHGHGTHTMGIMLGSDGVDDQIGVAPGANWIACRGCNTSTCTDAALLACAQFLLAPTDLDGENPDPDLRPHVINNSWGDCGLTYDAWYQSAVDAWQAAGIYPIFSNGNASNCSYSYPPGLGTVGNPARYGNVTGVGSSGRSDGLYATHSNWGPTDNLDPVNPTESYSDMKPQVIAPGVGIKSSFSYGDTAYVQMSGTSMSAPHVSGLVALMWQASPCLIGNYALTERILEHTSTPIIYNDGSPLTSTNYPNYAAGWGEINTLQAVETALKACGNSLIQGTVSNRDGLPLQGVHISITGTFSSYPITLLTDAAGEYRTKVLADTYSISASFQGYITANVYNFFVEENSVLIQDFIIDQHKSYYFPIIFK